MKSHDSITYSIAEASAALTKMGDRPVGIDRQKPHKKDEVYVVINGSGTFEHGGQRTLFHEGDTLFVRAGVDHRFVDFSADFATWVFFYGPEGGE